MTTRTCSALKPCFTAWWDFQVETYFSAFLHRLIIFKCVMCFNRQFYLCTGEWIWSRWPGLWRLCAGLHGRWANTNVSYTENECVCHCYNHHGYYLHLRRRSNWIHVSPPCQILPPHWRAACLQLNWSHFRDVSFPPSPLSQSSLQRKVLSTHSPKLPTHLPRMELCGGTSPSVTAELWNSLWKSTIR